jgi:hypothetical protein
MICLLSSVRNAGKHLREWFHYHRSIGITRFYVIDHQPSQDDTSEILAEQPDTVVLRKRGPFDESRWSAELCNTAIRDGATALFPNDTDEFLCGNGATFNERVREVIARIEVEDLTGLHFLSPGFNMFPSADNGDNDDWRSHVLARPNPLFTGKSAVFLAPQSGHVVTNGCQHRLRLRPPLPATVRSDAVPSAALKLRPEDFPFQYLHFPFHGPSAFLRRVRTFVQGPKDKVWQMATRYGAGLVDEERRASGDLTDADLVGFVLQLNDLNDRTDGGRELYRRAILDAGLPRACEVRTNVADFFETQAPREWSAELLSESLKSFGGLDRAGAGPLTEAEFVLWPIGAMQLQRMEYEQQRTLTSRVPDLRTLD